MRRETHRWGHPRGLTVLFLTETWEKFSYFGMRALLIYYMTGPLAFSFAKASVIYGSYAALCYLTPIGGGLLADRVLGRRRAVLAGGVTMAIGHFMMAFEPLFYVALVTIALGSGLYLPSLGGQVGDLYPEGDSRRARAFSIYYVGINLGAFVAPLVCGTLGEWLGWHWGFGAAGIGMIFGVLIYWRGAEHLPASVWQPVPLAARATATGRSLRDQVPVLVAIILIVILFRSVYSQAGNTIALWAKTGVDRAVSTQWSIPMTWFQSLNALFVFLLTPFVLGTWRGLARKGREPATLIKMFIGAAIVSVAFAVVAVSGAASQASGMPTQWPWLVLFFLLYTAGELWILPTGLALFGQVGSGSYAATGIAFWFLAAFGGSLLGGALGALWGNVPPEHFFFGLSLISLLAALLFLALSKSRAARYLPGNGTLPEAA